MYFRLLAGALVSSAALSDAHASTYLNQWEVKARTAASAPSDIKATEVTLEERTRGAEVHIEKSTTDLTALGAFAKVDNGVVKASTAAGTNLLGSAKPLSDISSMAQASFTVQLVAQGAASLFANAYLHYAANVTGLGSRAEIESAFSPWTDIGSASIYVASKSYLMFSIKDVELNEYSEVSVDSWSYGEYSSTRNRGGNQLYYDYAGTRTEIRNVSPESVIPTFDVSNKEYTRKSNISTEAASNYALPINFRDGAHYEINMTASCFSVVDTSHASLINSDSPLNSACQADRSMYWNGLTDIFGNADSEFKLVDEETGLDYAFGNPNSPLVVGKVDGGGWPKVASPIPEPSTWLLLMTGFGIVAGASRHRRRGVKVTYA